MSLGLPQHCWPQAENRVAVRQRAVRSAVGNDAHWMRGWLAVGPRCIAVAAADVVAVLCAAS
jgi:hypothetical protein